LEQYRLRRGCTPPLPCHQRTGTRGTPEKGEPQPQLTLAFSLPSPSSRLEPVSSHRIAWPRLPNPNPQILCPTPKPSPNPLHHPAVLAGAGTAALRCSAGRNARRLPRPPASAFAREVRTLTLLPPLPGSPFSPRGPSRLDG
jgi:hypothetical protein